MPFPHFDREETISEDIGFKGPHFNEPKNYPNPTPYPGHGTWSPQGEFGQHGEFTGWRSAEDPPSYRSDWQDYPADEFTGIETISPNIFQGKKPRGGGRGALQSFPRGITSGNRRGPGPWNDFSVGYDNPRIMGQDWDEDLLAKIYTSDMPGMQDPGFFWDSITPEAEAINTILNMPGMKEMRQGSVDDWNYKDFREKVPQYLWDQLPEGAFETLFDFRNQQPITVI